MRFPRLLWLLLSWLPLLMRAADPVPVLPLRTNDVIAFIGGANMVALAQSGHLETLLTLRHPHHRLRFRSLAWEGDTVFAQPRDVNYPDLVTQLKQVGATVAFVQFGQMESLAGEAGLKSFARAYEKFLDQIMPICGRVVLFRPLSSKTPLDLRYGITDEKREADLIRYSEQIRNMALSRSTPAVMLLESWSALFQGDGTSSNRQSSREETESEKDRLFSETMMLTTLPVLLFPPPLFLSDKTEEVLGPRKSLRSAIAEKNRLWFDYARPSNWAFLAGDRTEQAFSRDYRDRNIRAFAQEMQQFLPLIADAEKRIDELAAKAAAEKESTR